MASLAADLSLGAAPGSGTGGAVDGSSGWTAIAEIPGIVGGLRASYRAGASRSLASRKSSLTALLALLTENKEALIGAVEAASAAARRS